MFINWTVWNESTSLRAKMIFFSWISLYSGNWWSTIGLYLTQRRKQKLNYLVIENLFHYKSFLIEKVLEECILFCHKYLSGVAIEKNVADTDKQTKKN